MKKFFLIALVSVLMTIGALSLFMNKCVEPDEMEIVLIQLTCAQSIETDTFIMEACEAIHGVANCKFVEGDRPAIERLFLDKVNACTLEILKSRNMCLDKYEAM